MGYTVDQRDATRVALAHELCRADGTGADIRHVDLVRRLVNSDCGGNQRVRCAYRGHGQRDAVDHRDVVTGWNT